MFVPRFESADAYLTFLINRRIAMMCGAIMLAGIAMVAFWYFVAFENAQKYSQANIVSTGRLHKFDGLMQPTCTAVYYDETNELALRDLSFYTEDDPNAFTSLSRAKHPDFCVRLMSGARDWYRYERKYQTSTAEKAFFSVLAVIVLLYGWSTLTVAGGFLIYAVTGSIRAGIAIASVLLLPFVVGMVIFLWSAWNPRASSWDTSAGYVETTKVFIGADGRIYRAPASLFDWSDESVMDDLTEQAGIGRRPVIPGRW